MFNQLKNARRKIPGFQKCIKRETHANHYDALELTPKASQDDVKGAYYKLSKIYHPDLKEGNDQKFREITAAYEVLGNIKMRRIYDRGFLTDERTGMANRHASSEETNSSHFDSDPYEHYSTLGRKTSKVPMTGKTRFYNFDEWARIHYSNTFKKDGRLKAKRETMERLHREEANNASVPFFTGIIIAFLIVSTMGTILTFDDNYDKPRKRS